MNIYTDIKKFRTGDTVMLHPKVNTDAHPYFKHGERYKVFSCVECNDHVGGYKLLVFGSNTIWGSACWNLASEIKPKYNQFLEKLKEIE